MRGHRRPAASGVLEERLLQVCFLPLPEAATVWDRDMAASLSIDDLPTESHALLPLLHRRLVELDRRPAEIGRLQGVRRRLWVQNELRLRSVHAAVEVLHDAGAGVLLLGGLAVLARHLGRTDLRPIHDADLLVEPTSAASARDALVAHGWTVEPRWQGGFLLDVNGIRCTDGAGRSVSLRWSSAPPYDDAIDRSVTAELGDSSYDVVCDADLVVHTLLDGAGVHRSSDVLGILLGDQRPDWGRVVTTATARRGGVTVAGALARLDRIVPLGVPPDATRCLAASPAADTLNRLSRQVVRRVGRRLGRTR